MKGAEHSKMLPPACLLAALVLTAGIQAPAAAQEKGARVRGEMVTLEQNIGDRLPMDLRFRGAEGETVSLGDLLGERPAILALVYFRCPSLCTLVLEGLVDVLKDLDMEPGSDFEVVVVSIAPGEGPQLAASNRRACLEAYGRPGTAGGWHFLTAGSKEQVDNLARVVGYRYSRDPETGLYDHPAGIMLVTPEGVLSRYFYGTSYRSRDVRLGLVEASGEKLGSPVDQLVLLCLQYDPETGKYGMPVFIAMRVLGLLTTVGLAGFIGFALLKERRRKQQTDKEV